MSNTVLPSGTRLLDSPLSSSWSDRRMSATSSSLLPSAPAVLAGGLLAAAALAWSFFAGTPSLAGILVWSVTLAGCLAVTGLVGGGGVGRLTDAPVCTTTLNAIGPTFK